jgi:adenosylcobinamide-phosphate synthase
MEHRAPRNNPRAEFIYGAGMAASGMAIAALPALALERLFPKRSRSWVGVFAIALALKVTLAWRGLIRAGQSVQRDLETGAADGARADLQALVSRDTRPLATPLLAAAAIESLAENASDAFIAPLFYYYLFGLPGAFVYRAVNTLDSMIGYHGRYEFLGKVSARLDDVLNIIPARLTALLIVLASGFGGAASAVGGAASGLRGAAARKGGEDAVRAWRSMQRDHALTESPNAGYPMSAMAGALDVRLEKVGHYRLNADGELPQPCDIQRAANLVSIALTIGVVTSGLLFLLLPRRASR